MWLKLVYEFKGLATIRDIARNIANNFKLVCIATLCNRLYAGTVAYFESGLFNEFVARNITSCGQCLNAMFRNT